MEDVNDYTAEEFNLRLNYVAVHPYEEGDEVTESGIVVEGGMKKYDEWQNGRILAVGPGLLTQGVRNPMTIEVGDRVSFNINDGESANKVFTLDGRKVYIMQESKLMMGFKEVQDSE